MSAGVQPLELVFLRLGVSAVVLAPYLWIKRKSLSTGVWKASFGLAVLHGWGMVSLVLLGIQFAPSLHAGALGPGTMPIWMALFYWWFGNDKPSRCRLISLGLIAVSVGVIVSSGNASISVTEQFAGDLSFIAAAGCGAGYLYLAKKWGIPALLGVALCAVLSLPIVLLAYLWLGIIHFGRFRAGPWCFSSSTKA